MNSLFDSDTKNATSACYDLAEHIFEAIRVGTDEFIDFTPLTIKKPVVVLLNTAGGPKKSVAVNPQQMFGSHWLAMVILSSDYLRYNTSYNSETHSIKKTPTVETIYLYDSLVSHRSFPKLLKASLTEEINEFLDNGDKNLLIIPPCISKNAHWLERTYKFLQSPDDNNCGFWSLANAVMTIFDGADYFWESLATKHELVNPQGKMQAGLHLRRLFKEILIANNFLKKNIVTPEPKETLLADSPLTLNNHLISTNLQSLDRVNLSNLSTNFPLIPEFTSKHPFQQCSIRLTKKGEPDKRQRAFKAAQTPGTKSIGTKRKHESQKATFLEDPENLSPVRKHFKRNNPQDQQFNQEDTISCLQECHE